MTIPVPFLDNRYDDWPDDHHEWGSLEEFVEANAWPDGIHTIPLGDGPALDLLFKDQPLNAPVTPVFFNGAITGRETKHGPFFSGRGLAATGQFGFIGVSDPSVNLHESLGLAWYAGNKYGPFQDQLTRIFQRLADVSGSELLFIGGSGGGFASLYYGHRLAEKASVLVWNPQTDVLRYNPQFVKNYLSRAFDLDLPQHGWEPAALAGTQGVDLSIAQSRPRRLLYMQNASDWHVQSHTAPFLASGYEHCGRGVFESDPHHVVQIADYGEGHAALPDTVLLSAIECFKDTAVTASAVSDRLVARRGQGWHEPSDPSPALCNLLGPDRTICSFRS
ncbi:hypothetical protein [Devriesea agamarum]|uniref:hypothetical protein n=1 Tax=Devriesea agamarum TaxID=472569 RepID=UPI00071C872F|nr:hypothetical protein [Devriesea agamarum]